MRRFNQRRKAVHAETKSRSVTAVANFPLRSELNCSLLSLLTPQGTSTLVSREPTMMNWPQFLVRADDCATGFLTGAGATSVIVFAGAAAVLLVHGVCARCGALRRRPRERGAVAALAASFAREISLTAR